ncbi:MAG: hypothetical protein ABT10_15995 [Novosphingobium sp. SCN 63-17]|nr:MAG: hypothetical protein ABT10_15995 [Novosphingobium sp. SCN 63-17]OJX87873.1 MAG: hypothetical protein BGP00_00150 [Novosphingobium sp. 63-713]
MAGAGLGPIPGDAGPDAMREAAAAWLAKINGPAGDACREDFEDWYNADPRHAEAFEAILETWEQSRLAAFTPLATSRQALRRREDKGRSGWPKVLLAAAASIGLTVAVLVGYAIHHRDASERRASELVEVASRVGEIRTLTLPDGSHVTLDTASAIRLAFAGDERRIVLERGRARFEVAHDPSRLFVVQAGNRLVIAHGTIFDVDLNEQHIAVTLLRGSVEVKRSADPADGANRSGMMLVPGQRLTWGLETASSPILSSAAASDAVPVAATGEITGWPSGMLVFDDRRLADVIAQANRYSEHPIVLADRASGALHFTGTVAAKDTEGLAGLLAASFHLALTRDAEGNFILSSLDTKKVPG